MKKGNWEGESRDLHVGHWHWRVGDPFSWWWSWSQWKRWKPRPTQTPL